MKESDQSNKFQFPWYNGVLPKALRSSRVRRGLCGKGNLPVGDLNSMDLLAAVAGQVLQDKRMHEGIDGLQKVHPDENRDGDETEGSSRAELPSHCCQMSDSLDIHMVQVPEHKSSEGVSAMQTKAQQCPENDMAFKWGGFDVMSPNKVGFLGYQESLQCSVLNNSRSDKEECKTHGDHGRPVLEEGTPDLLETGCVNYPRAHKKNDTDSISVWSRNARERAPLPDESPLPVSSSSSEEAPILVHTFSCSRFQPLERHLGCSQDLARFKAKDDDDNFSHIAAPVAASPTMPSKPLVSKASQVRKLRCGSIEEEVFLAGAKGKALRVDGHNKQKNDLNHTRERLVKDPCHAKRRFPSGSLKLCSGLDKSSCLKQVNMDVKEASVASSPTTASKVYRRPMKKKLKSAHELSAVKVNITSFEVPELSINLPETATIASLKRAVMEAAVGLLAGGLHVRVLHHGKRVHDENSTLVQMGIACKGRTDSLAFMLEPNAVASIPMNVEEALFTCQKAENQPATGCLGSHLADDLHGHSKEAGNHGVACNDVVTEKSSDAARQDKSDTDSQVIHPCPPAESFQPTTAALILHPGFKENQSVVTANHSFEGFTVKRRTRRPFTVTEVEALVQAVELLGTGRWREVKQQVFSHARHRTYVDLKDKWKTLVHTARIAPHQRRGEPVPQELLDRVLRAHNYWALQLAKHQEVLGI